MRFKTIMSACGITATDKELKSIAELCRQEEAHLSLLIFDVSSPPPMAEYTPGLPEVWAKERQEDLDAIAERARLASIVLETAGISFDVQTQYTDPLWADDMVGLHARYCDLIVLGPTVCQDPVVSGPTISGVLFASARPVLMLPHAGQCDLKPTTVVIAWDSSQQAARAVYDALPILKRAREVSITMVDPDARYNAQGQEPGADLATYLARHAIAVRVDRLVGRGRDTADVIKEHVVDLAAGMLVMGAYGHSRLRERIFGGTTRAFIKDPEVPIFLAH